MQHSTARVPITALIIALVVGLAGCGDPPLVDFSPRASGSFGPSGPVRIGVERGPDSLNPGNGLRAESYDLFELVYDTPIALSADGEYVPELASSWDVSADGLTWTLEILDGVTFHDGTPLTSEDVEYSLELYRDTTDFPYLPFYADAFTDVAATSPTELVIRTAAPVGNFASRMTHLYVLPKHIWEEQPDPVAFLNEEMVGSGPFELDDVEPGVSATLEANRSYWKGRPSVDEVVFQTVADPDARLAALADGDVDLVVDLPAAAIADARETGGVEVYAADGTPGAMSDIFFNVVDPARCPEDAGGLCTGHPALRDVAVRRALALATDRQRIVDDVLGGVGSPGRSLVPPGLGEWAVEEPDAFDPQAAEVALDEAGYEDTDEDGVRECLPSQGCPTGDLTFRFMYASNSERIARQSELVAEMWAEIGVRIEPQPMPPDDLAALCCPTFDFDIISWRWNADTDPAFLLGLALCDEIATGFSETGYCNPDYDELYARQRIETDHDARLDLIHELQEILIEDVPYLVPYYEQTVQAYRTDRFTGWLLGERTLGLQAPDSLVAIHAVE